MPPRRLSSHRRVTVPCRNSGFALDAPLTGVSPSSREGPMAKHCGMFRCETRGACVDRQDRLADSVIKQTGCGCNQAQTIGGDAVAGAQGFCHRARACEPHSQGRRSSAGEENRTHPVFQPNNGTAVHSPQTRTVEYYTVHSGRENLPNGKHDNKCKDVRPLDTSRQDPLRRKL